MPSVYTAPNAQEAGRSKEGFNPISATNLLKGHPKYYQAGDPVKKYEKKGFNPVVLSNLIPKQKGTGKKVVTTFVKITIGLGPTALLSAV